MTDLFFSYSFVLWFIVLIPLYLYFRFIFFKKANVSYAPLQYKAPNNRRHYYFYLELVLETLLLATILVGIADPHKVSERSMIREDGLDIALVLDVSASMQAADFTPNRLEAMKGIAKDFIKFLILLFL
mgnify:FL=1